MIRAEAAPTVESPTTSSLNLPNLTGINGTSTPAGANGP
jgi:hypothetical protein